MKTRKILTTVALSIPVLLVWACSGDESEPPGGGSPPPAPSSTGSIDPPQGEPSARRQPAPESTERRAPDPAPVAETTPEAACVEQECLAHCQSQGVTGGCVEGSCNCVLPEDAGVGDFDAMFGDFQDPTSLGNDPAFGDAGSLLDPGPRMPGTDSGLSFGDPNDPFGSDPADPFGNQNGPGNSSFPGDSPSSNMPGAGDAGLGMSSLPGQSSSDPSAPLPTSSADFRDPQPQGLLARPGSNPMSPSSRTSGLGPNQNGTEPSPLGMPGRRQGPAQRSPFGGQPRAVRGPAMGGGDGGVF